MSKTSKQKDFFLTDKVGSLKLGSFALRFQVKGLGHIPSFKNSKMILGVQKIKEGPCKGLWKGTPFIATKTEYRHMMEALTRSLLSQLISASRTIGDGTLTAQQQLFAIVLSMPADDSRQWLKHIRINCETVVAGEEGAEIIVRRL